jgi:hypothetical protein
LTDNYPEEGDVLLGSNTRSKAVHKRNDMTSRRILTTTLAAATAVVIVVTVPVAAAVSSISPHGLNISSTAVHVVGNSVISPSSAPRLASNPQWLPVSGETNGKVFVESSNTANLYTIRSLVPKHFFYRTFAPAIPTLQLDQVTSGNVLTDPSPSHPYGTLVLWVAGTRPQQGLTPAVTLERIQVLDLATDTILSSVIPTVPSLKPYRFQDFYPELATGNVLAGELAYATSNPENDVYAYAGFNISTGAVLWHSQEMSSSDQGVPYGTFLFIPENCENSNNKSVLGLDGMTGRVLFNVEDPINGCQDSPYFVNAAWCGTMIIPQCQDTVELSVGTWVTGDLPWILNVRTGATVQPPTLLNNYSNGVNTSNTWPYTRAVYWDGRSSLDVVQGTEGPGGLGSVVVYNTQGTEIFRGFSQSKVSALRLHVKGICGKEVFASTSTENLVFNAVTGSVIRSSGLPGNISTVECGPGWFLVWVASSFEEQPEEYLLQSGMSLSDALSLLHSPAVCNDEYASCNGSGPTTPPPDW